jgi:hypothetical protein
VSDQSPGHRSHPIRREVGTGQSLITSLIVDARIEACASLGGSASRRSKFRADLPALCDRRHRAPTEDGDAARWVRVDRHPLDRQPRGQLGPPGRRRRPRVAVPRKVTDLLGTCDRAAGLSKTGAARRLIGMASYDEADALQHGLAAESADDYLLVLLCPPRTHVPDFVQAAAAPREPAWVVLTRLLVRRNQVILYVNSLEEEPCLCSCSQTVVT